MDPAWGVAAFGIGLGASALLIQAFAPKGQVAPPRLTSTWRLDELDRPTVVCRDLGDLDLPSGSRVLASGRVEAVVLRRTPVRRVPDVPAEFALAGDGRRALLFAAGLRPAAWAMPTTDPVVLDRLRSQVAALDAAATAYLERRRVAELVGDPGLPVEAEGTVREILPRSSGHLLRLEDDGHVAAVRVGTMPEGLAGRRVTVRGRLGRDASGYAVVDADEIQPH